MSGQLGRRRFLNLSAVLAAGMTSGIARPSIASAQEAQPLQVMGYDATFVPDFSTDVTHPNTQTFESAVTLASVQKSMLGTGYDYFSHALDSIYAAQVGQLESYPLPYDRQVMAKAIVAFLAVNATFHYTMSTHRLKTTTEIDDGDGHIRTYDKSVYVDSVLTPDQLAKNGWKGDCVDYSAARFAWLRNKVPSEDVLYCVGSLHQDLSKLKLPYEKAGGYHACTMVRSPGSNKWIMMETEDGEKKMPFCIAENANIKNLGLFYTPLFAMDGNLRLIQVDSLDRAGIPKPLPPTEALAIEIAGTSNAAKPPINRSKNLSSSPS